jgi:hypothetical protein
LHEIEFGWPIKSNLRQKYLEKHVWDNPNAYKNDFENESAVPSETPKPAKRLKRTARKSFVTARLAQPWEVTKTNSFKDKRNEQLKKLKAMRSEIVQALWNEKDAEEKIKLKALLKNVEQDIDKFDANDVAASRTSRQQATALDEARTSETGSSHSAFALAQRLATDMESPKSRRTGSSTSSVATLSSIKARLLDNTPLTNKNSSNAKLGANSEARPSTKPDNDKITGVSSHSAVLSGASTSTVPDAKKTADSSNSSPRPGTSTSKTESSRTETKPVIIITKSFFSGLG